MAKTILLIHLSPSPREKKCVCRCFSLLPTHRPVSRLENRTEERRFLYGFAVEDATHVHVMSRTSKKERICQEGIRKETKPTSQSSTTHKSYMCLGRVGEHHPASPTLTSVIVKLDVGLKQSVKECRRKSESERVSEKNFNNIMY